MGRTAAAQSIDYGSLQQMFNEPVTTSATGSPQRSTEVPVAMDIITAEDIKRSGATDLPTILSRVPGLDILQWGAQSADVGVRGYDGAYSPRLLVLVNGRQVYLDHFGYTAWASIPVQLYEIRQIEIVKGPNSALFGFNAVSGVVNIITYNPKYDDVNVVTARGGTRGDKEGSLVSTFKIGKLFSARGSIGGVQQDEWQSPAVGPNPHPRPPAHVTADLDTITQLDEKTELRVEGSYSNANINELSLVYLDFNTKYLTKSIKSSLDTDSKFGQVDLSVYHNEAEIHNFVVDFKNDITVVSAQDLFKIGSANTFRASGEFRRNDDNITPSGPGHVSYNVFTIAGMWNWAPTSKLAVTAAGRFDNLVLARSGPLLAGTPYPNSAYDRTIAEPSFNVGAVWRPTSQDTLRLTAARGVALPSLAVLGSFAQLNQGRQSYYGNPDVNPALIYNYELDYDRPISLIDGKVSARLFYQRTEQVLSQGLVPANLGASIDKGVELVASGALAGGFRWSANYALTEIDNKAPPNVSIVDNQIDFSATTPEHRGNLGFGWSDKFWSFDSFIRFVSKYQEYQFLSPVLANVPGYATVAGRMARDFDHGVTLAISGENLLQERQRQTVGPEAERRVLVSLSKSW